MSYVRNAAALPLYLLALGTHDVAIGFMWISDRLGNAGKWVLRA